MKFSKNVAGIAAVLSLYGLFATQTAAQETTLKGVSFLPLNVNFGAYFKRWVDEVNRRGKGLLQITALGPEAIPTLEQANALRTGVVQLGFVPATYYIGIMWEMEALPLTEKTPQELRKNGAWEYLDKLHSQKMNTKLVGQLGDGVRMFVYTTRPIQSKDAMKPFDGFTLRSAPIYKAFFESVGARIVNIPPVDVYSALERSIVHGYGWPRWGIQDLGWLAVTKFRYGPGFYGSNVPIQVNLDAWNKLTDKQREFLDGMGIWLDTEWPKWRAERDKEEESVQDKAGVKYVDLGAEFVKRAYEARWAELEKRSPQHIPHLRRLLTR